MPKTKRSDKVLLLTNIYTKKVFFQARLFVQSVDKSIIHQKYKYNGKWYYNEKVKTNKSSAIAIYHFY